ncbi:hypothetical protein [Thalassospira sp. TSL5-1]|uniref:hypothetical protein n=1 Tax=Thalassospira sp. TSL5-1 TaxID=1544451 RepID=UPI0009401790|nr:hypothetical protein [Thalassospira sp. TSL5-1]OKH87067.1 hypothetical protein LF95_18920 [Thalassospira sp. TSL5-1]
MKNKISDSLKEIFYCLIADEYEVENTIKELSYLSMEEQERVREEFRKIIDQRLWSQDFYLGLTGFEFEAEDGFYAYLEEVWQYLFNQGPEPDIEKYWY